MTEKKEEVKQEKKQEEISSLPENFKEEKNVETKVTSLKKKVEDFLNAMKETATLGVMKPIPARLKDELKEIKKRNSANNIRIRRDSKDRGHWKTIPPELHIRNLEGLKIDNKKAEIKFEVYEMDEEGNKKLYANKTKVQLSDGSVVEREVTADYRIAYEVVLTLEYGKPTKREIIRYDMEGL